MNMLSKQFAFILLVAGREGSEHYLSLAGDGYNEQSPFSA